MMKSRMISLLILAVLSGQLRAYEIVAHGLITDHAYRISVLSESSPGSIYTVLGLDRLDHNYPFSFDNDLKGSNYRDEIPVTNPSSNLPILGLGFTRIPQPEEAKVSRRLAARGLIPGDSGDNIHQKIRSWLVRGAVREDDNDVRVPYVGIWWKVGNRDPDPYGRLLRAAGHFYDPIYNRSFDHDNHCEYYTCVRSISWALGSMDPLLPGWDSDNTSRRNHFTWQDARNNYWWALISKRDSQGDGYDFVDATVDGYDRMSRWATTMKSVGHVIHLLQDAAQPQHVRNDAHGPAVMARTPEGEADAAFEAFTDYRILVDRREALSMAIPEGNPLRRMNEELPAENAIAKLELGERNYYPGNGQRVQFSTPVKYFTTNHIEGRSDTEALLSRRGLADLSNRSFFTSGTLPGYTECPPPNGGSCSSPTYSLPPSDLTLANFSEVASSSGLRIGWNKVVLREYTYPVFDVVSPNYDAMNGVLSYYGGKAPLVTRSIWSDVVPFGLGNYLPSVGYVVTYNNMRYMADVMIPRAVGYSAGMIDFFFRGRLEVTPIEQQVFAVMNQGDSHFVDADGYPRRTEQPTRVFGFESVRLKVRNTTPAIIESGTSVSVPQSTGGPGSRLVAIARYHRNACYEPDLRGERVRSRNGTIAEPVCTERRPVRTNYQEISVSAPLSLAPGELDVATPIERRFDFSNDPIPVNATDLFIQVAYRGPLGEERDGIAVGMYDVSEPTFAAAWNNTDYHWTGAAWGPPNTANPLRNVYNYWGCAGSPSKYIYHFGGSQGAVAMPYPPDPGYVRLALILGKPESATQRIAVRSVPTMQTFPHAPVRSGFTRGQIRQASKELIPASVVASPMSGCFLSPPSAPEHWCFDPVEKRRGIVFGEIAQPIYYGLGDGTDVDSVPLPPWSNAIARSGGNNMFDMPGDLLNCPSQPTVPSSEIEDMELFEEIVARGGDH